MSQQNCKLTMQKRQPRRSLECSKQKVLITYLYTVWLCFKQHNIILLVKFWQESYTLINNKMEVLLVDKQLYAIILEHLPSAEVERRSKSVSRTLSSVVLVVGFLRSRMWLETTNFWRNRRRLESWTIGEMVIFGKWYSVFEYKYI